jgi:hypothetical protein
MTIVRIVGMVVAAFVAGSFIASDELRAYAANTVRSIDIVDGEVKTADIGNNAVTAAKIKDNEVKSAEIASNAVGANEIATDAVGGAELQGVSKLLFEECVLSEEDATSIVPTDGILPVVCSVNGVDSDDTAIATLSAQNSLCYHASDTETETDQVKVLLRSSCGTSVIGPATIGIVVFDK